MINRLLSNTKEAGSVISYLRETVTGEIITPDNMQRLCRSQSSRSSKSRSVNNAVTIITVTIIEHNMNHFIEEVCFFLFTFYFKFDCISMMELLDLFTLNCIDEINQVQII